MKPVSPGAKIGMGIGGVLLGLGGVGAFYTLTAPEISIPAPVPLPQPNGYDLYVGAARALVPANPPVDVAFDKILRSPAEIARNYAPARRRKWIATNSKSWNLLARALQTPTRNPHPRGAEVSVSLSYAPLRQLARGQSVRIQNFAARKQWGAALTTGLDTLQMGRDIERGASLIGSLVGMAVEAIGQRPLQEVPRHLSASEAKIGARRLEKLIAGATPFSAVLQEEKWGFATTLNNDWEKPGNRGAGFWGHFLLPKARVLRAHNAMVDEFIAQADKPARAQTKIEAPAPWNFPVNISYPVFPRALWNNERRQTQENLLLLRLALRAYRAENGSYPAKTEDLVPKYLTTIPHDAFGRGERLRYRKNGDSYLIWSIGPDGIDNGGAPILNNRGRKPRYFVPESRGDVVMAP